MAVPQLLLKVFPLVEGVTAPEDFLLPIWTGRDSFEIAATIRDDTRVSSSACSALFCKPDDMVLAKQAIDEFEVSREPLRPLLENLQNKGSCDG